MIDFYEFSMHLSEECGQKRSPLRSIFHRGSGILGVWKNVGALWRIG